MLLSCAIIICDAHIGGIHIYVYRVNSLSLRRPKGRLGEYQGEEGNGVLHSELTMAAPRPMLAGKGFDTYGGNER